MTDFIVCSYYTAKTGYEKEALTLEASFRLHKIEPYHIQRISNLGSWQKNTHFKAKFIKMMLKQYPQMAIVFVDADAVFHSYPKLFGEIGVDFACHFRNWHHRQGELLSGTLFFKNNGKMSRIVDEWIAVNKQNQIKFEQRNLERVIRRNAHIIDIYKLPVEYCCIFDDDNRRQLNPVIEHFQASRKYRRII